jgi:predicted nucleotidyltransferase
VDVSELLDVDVDRLDELCRQYGIARLEVFGSVARGEPDDGSDIDLIYELSPGARLGWEIADLEEELATCSAVRWTSSPSAGSTRCCAPPCSPRHDCSMGLRRDPAPRRPTNGGYPSSGRPAANLRPPPSGPAPGARPPTLREKVFTADR